MSNLELNSLKDNQGRPAANHASSSGGYFCCFKGPQPSDGPAPDDDFHADSLITLSKGLTAYRLIEPRLIQRTKKEQQRVIVCLHGLYDSSYIWSDIADLLTDFEQGPQASVLVYDFYGHGRSPWSGTDITLDTLVGQLKELLDCKFMFYIRLKQIIKL